MNSAELVRPSIVFTARRDDFHIAPSVMRCVKIDKPGPDTFFAPRNRLKIRNCPARKGLSVPDLSIFSHLLNSTLSIPETAKPPNIRPIRGFVDSFICRVWGHMQKPLTRL